MKKVLGLMLLAAVVLAGSTSCKSKQKVVNISGSDIEAAETKPVTQPVVVEEIESKETTRGEKFNLADGETNSAAFNKKFHVVVGSFGVQNNAKNLQRTLNSEGNSAIVECLSDEPCGCKIRPACRLAPILVRAFESLYQTLDEYSLADLVDKPDQSNQLRLLLKQA